jgi:Alginate export
MKHIFSALFILASFRFALVMAAEESPLEIRQASLPRAIMGGKPLLNLRPRYERVAQEGKVFDSNALTVRSLLGWQTGAYLGFSATAQFIDVGRANDNYEDGKNGKINYPRVADPDHTGINQLYLDYNGIPSTRVRLGTQSIKLDNVRMVGNVEFRQVMQVFTGLSVENKSLPGTTVFAAHLERLKNIFGDQKPVKIEMLNLAYQWAPGNNAIAYGYFHEQPVTASATGLADSSNRILGLRADGAYPLNETVKLLYTAEFAMQNDYAAGDARIDADYLRAGAGVAWGAYYVRLDQELLSSNNGVYAFQSPLGTNHLFQGWADQFLTTPANGIRDTFLSAGATVGKAKILGEYHDFKSDVGSVYYGTGIDIGVTYPLAKGLNGKIEYASFREGDVLAPAARKRDTNKLWLTLIYQLE